MNVYQTGQRIKEIDDFIQRVKDAAHWISISNPDGTTKWSLPKLRRIQRQLDMLNNLENSIIETYESCNDAQCEWLDELRDRIEKLDMRFSTMRHEEQQLLNQKETD